MQQSPERPDSSNPPDEWNSQVSHNEEVPESTLVKIHTKQALIFWGYLLVYATFFAVCVYFTVAADKKLADMQASDAYYYGNQVAYTWKKGK